MQSFFSANKDTKNTSSDIVLLSLENSKQTSDLGLVFLLLTLNKQTVTWQRLQLNSTQYCYNIPKILSLLKLQRNLGITVLF